MHAHLDKSPFSLNFNYQSMIGKLNYLAQTTRPGIMYATHQLVKYSTTWGRSSLSRSISQEISWHRNPCPTRSHQGIQMLLQRRLLRTLEQAIRLSRSKYFEILQQMDCFLRRMSYHLGILTSDPGRPVDHWSQIYRDVSVSTRCSPHHVPHPGNERERLPSYLHATLCLLESLWRQFWHFRACATLKVAPLHQAYQRVLPPLLRTCAKWIDQDLPHWH